MEFSTFRDFFHFFTDLPVGSLFYKKSDLIANLWSTPQKWSFLGTPPLKWPILAKNMSILGKYPTATRRLFSGKWRFWPYFGQNRTIWGYPKNRVILRILKKSKKVENLIIFRQNGPFFLRPYALPSTEIVRSFFRLFRFPGNHLKSLIAGCHFYPI